jgi:flagellar biosynthesis/type III secretory pathway protein FliH
VEGLAEGKAKGLAEGKAKGLAEGKAKGLAEGKAKGLAEGKAKGKAEALLDVLALRNLSLDDAVRARILGEHDLARLQRWLSRAMTCATVAEP